jgi:hypothetical protein
MKISGLGMSLSVDDSGGAPVPIENDVTDFTVNTSRGEQNVTGIDVEALERLLLLGDAEISLKGTFNKDVSHSVFKDIGVLKAGEVGRTVTVGYPDGVTLDMEMIFTSYNIARGADGSLTWTATGKLSDGVVPTFAP